MPDPVTSLTPAPTQTITATEPISLGGVLRTVPQFDPIDALVAAPNAQDWLRALRQRREDAGRLNIEFEIIRQASLERTAAQNRLQQLTGHRSVGGHEQPADANSVIQAQKLVDKSSADLERLKQLQEVRAAAWTNASQATAAVESWCRDGRPQGVVLHDHETEPPKLLKSESLLDGIERLRRRGRELRADLHRIASAPFPSSHAKAQMRRQIEILAQRGQPDVGLLIEHDRDIAWQLMRLTSEVHAEKRHLAFTEVPDTVALFAWLHKSALIAALDALVDAESDDAASLTHEARERAEAEVRRDLLSVERDESALVWRAQSESLPVEHRSDCDPRAILQIRMITVTNGHAPETTPGYAYDRVNSSGRK